MSKSEQISFRVTPKLKIRLKNLADLEKRTLGDYIVNRLEDLVDVLDSMIDNNSEYDFAAKEERIKDIAKIIDSK